MSKKYYMSWDEVIDRLKYIDRTDEIIYGIPRGGMCMLAALKNARVTITPSEATIIADDVVDSGTTRDKWMKKYPNAYFYTLVDKCSSIHPKQIKSDFHTKDKNLPWIVYPWETDKSDTVENHIIRIYQLCNFNDQNYYEHFFRENVQHAIELAKLSKTSHEKAKEIQ